MASNHHTDEVFTQKRKPKNPIKFQLQLNEEQKLAKALIVENPVVVLKGMAGSGKTLVAVQAALDMLFCKEVEKIIITRPTVAKEELGFLPGDLKEKMDPWLAPIYHNLYMLYGKDKVDKEIEYGNIEIVPFAFMRGRTFVNSFVIVDEAQNVTHDQMETVLGRLGKGSKMVICGDLAQIDLKVKKDTGFSFLTRIEEQVPGFKVFALLQNHRHEIVSPILKVYQDFRD
jgi:phosphate starvation-inducible PhoH-like protein